eukprot:g12737.t1
MANITEGALEKITLTLVNDDVNGLKGFVSTDAQRNKVCIASVVYGRVVVVNESPFWLVAAKTDGSNPACNDPRPGSGIPVGVVDCGEKLVLNVKNSDVLEGAPLKGKPLLQISPLKPAAEYTTVKTSIEKVVPESSDDSSQLLELRTQQQLPDDVPMPAPQNSCACAQRIALGCVLDFSCCYAACCPYPKQNFALPPGAGFDGISGVITCARTCLAEYTTVKTSAASVQSCDDFTATASCEDCNAQWTEWDEQGGCKGVSLPISDPCMRHEHGILLTGETFFVGGKYNEEATFWLDSTNKEVESGKWKLYNAVQAGAARKAARKGLRDAMADESKTTFCFGGGQDDQVAALFSLPQEAKQITLVHKAGAIAIGNLVHDDSSPELDNWASWPQHQGRITPWIVAGKADTRGQEDTPTSKRRDGVAPLRVSYERMKDGKIQNFDYKPVKEWGDELESWGEQKKITSTPDLHTMPVRVRAQGGPQAKSIDFRDGPLSSFPAGDYSVVIGENYWSNSEDNQGVTCVQAIACVADVTERTPATATASYFHHRRDDNVLTIKVCTTANAKSLGRPHVYTYRRHDDQGEPVSSLKLSPGTPKWGKYVAGPNPGEGNRVAHSGSAWSWNIKTEVDSNIRLDFSREKVQPLNEKWTHLDGICISEVRTEDKVLTKVPFWLDTVCEAQAHDYTGYYNHFDHEGRVKCWGPVREWGPFLNTRRALSLKTCREGFKGWSKEAKGSLMVEITMKGDSDSARVLEHSFDANDGLNKAGLQTSVLFDSTSDGGTGSPPVSIAEEELESVKLTVAGTNIALCIEQVVYESVVLTNAPFLLDLKLPNDADRACGSRINSVYGDTGIQQCYTESRVMKVSKSRLALQQCDVGWAVEGGSAVGKEVEVKLQFTTTTRKRPASAAAPSSDGGEPVDNAGDDLSVSSVSKHVAWKPNQPPTEPLIIPLEHDDLKEIQIEVVSPKTMVCISEVRLGMYSEQVVVEKNSFLLVGKDNPACNQGAARIKMVAGAGGGSEGGSGGSSSSSRKVPCYDTTRRLPIPPHATAAELSAPQRKDEANEQRWRRSSQTKEGDEECPHKDGDEDEHVCGWWRDCEGDWGDWSDSECDTPEIGMKERKFKVRVEPSPEPLRGKDCTSKDGATEHKQREECNADCKGEWGPWGECEPPQAADEHEEAGGHEHAGRDHDSGVYIRRRYYIIDPKNKKKGKGKDCDFEDGQEDPHHTQRCDEGCDMIEKSKAKKMLSTSTSTTSTSTTPQRESEILEATTCDPKRVANAKEPDEPPDAFTAKSTGADYKKALARKGRKRVEGDRVKLRWEHLAYGKIKLDYNHEGGICISELRTVDADETASVLRTWTLVPFWLDKNCDRDGGDGKYYRGDGTEGQLKCWGTTREFGFGAGVENKRAISVTTCDNSTKLAGTKGGLSANVKMLRDGSEIMSQHVPHLDNDKHMVESSVVFVSEEELNTVSLALTAKNEDNGLGGHNGICISKLVYESVVLANFDFL